jgi:hypothetical protein
MVGKDRMKRLLLTLELLGLATSQGSAVSRHNITNMSCEQIRALLKKERSAILVFPAARTESLNRYGLFVDERACRAPQVSVKKRVRSTTGTCFVYQCADATRSQER